MKNKSYCEKSNGSNKLNSDVNTIENAKINALGKPSPELLQYYKKKASRLEKEFDNLSELLDNIKSACDFSTELQVELNLRNEEVARLQQVISDLQIHLFREKEHCLKLSAENDRLKIQEFEDKKKINALLMLTGISNSEIVHLLSRNAKSTFIEKKLPVKLQKLKDLNQNKCKIPNCDIKNQSTFKNGEIDPQVLILKNHSLAAQLEHHICISRDQIQVLLKDRELAFEEREIERRRLQNELDLMFTKLKQAQDNLCETSSKLVKCQKNFEKERNIWMEEKDNYIKALNNFQGKQEEKYPDVMGYSVSGVGYKKARICAETEFMKELLTEKEQLANSYQEQIVAMEAEINRLKERAVLCRKTFKEKMEKMTAQTTYLKNKYEDLDRRRQLEAEGFRTDIKMLRERLKELEKKLAKANISYSAQTSEQQLLISAKSTLNRARQLEKELMNMKSKMSVKGVNESS